MLNILKSFFGVPGVYVLNLNPNIAFCQHVFFRDFEYHKHKYKRLKFFKGTLLTCNNWHWYDPKYRVGQYELILKGYAQFQKEFPNIRVIWMLADDSEYLGFKQFDTIFFNRNATINPDKWFINNDEPELDCIHNAVLYEYKRHELTFDLPYTIGVIYYTRLANELRYIREKDVEYANNLLEKMKQQKNLVMLNGIDNYRFLNRGEVCSWYNKAKCGLVLSDIEGINLTSVEYLLSGLPVVSTKNLGGRDFFLKNNPYAITDLKPNEISYGIKYFIENKYDKEEIRKYTKNRIEEHWETLLPQLDMFMDTSSINLEVLKQSWYNVQDNIYKLYSQAGR